MDYFKKKKEIQRLKNYKKIQDNFITENINIIKVKLGSLLLYRFIFHPLDRIKLLKQTSYINNFSSYKSIYDEIKNNYNKNLLKGMYRGNFISLFYGAISTSLNILMINTFSIALNSKGYRYYNNTELIIRKAMACVLSSMFVNVVIYPIERIKLITLSDLNGNINNNFFTIFFNILKNEGITQLYKGYLLDSLFKFPQFLFIYSLYNNFSNNLNEINKCYIIYFMSNIFIYPLKIIKKNYQADSLALNTNNLNYTSVKDIVSKNINKYGPRFLYNGISLYIVNNLIIIYLQNSLINIVL